MGEKQIQEKKPPKYRSLGKIWTTLFMLSTVIGTIFSINEIFQIGFVYHEYVYYYGLIGFFLSFSFILFPVIKGKTLNKVPWYDVVFFLLTIFCCVYFAYNASRISDEGWVYTGPPSSIACCLITWILVLEALRRVGGVPLFCFATAFSLFPLFAHLMPGFLEGAGWSLTGAAKFHAMTREGVIGIPTRVFCNLLVGFMIFGVALQTTGGGKFFLNLAYALLGSVRGGPAKVSVVASAFFGSLSGSALSNVVTTGAMTIPTMKKNGYPNYFAGAVEACASSGGCIMPPVMGAVAFIMASFLMVPYASVAISALVPALLYFWGLFVQIDGYAARTGLHGMPKDQLPSLKQTLKEGWIYIFSLVILIYLLFYLRQEAQAPFYATLALLVGSIFTKNNKPSKKSFFDLAIGSGKILCEIISTLAGVGLIIGGLSMTGVAINFSSELVRLAGDNSLLLLLVGAIVSFFLGMGMVISATYIFLAIVLIPALTPFGFDPMAIHLFVIYCGLFSFITPPVALASYTAAGIAESDPWKTGTQSMRLGFVKYLIPFLFVLNPALILHASIGEIFISIITVFAGVTLIGSSIEGYLIVIGKLNMARRILLSIGGILLCLFNWKLIVAGFVISAAVIIHIMLQKKNRPKQTHSGENNFTQDINQLEVK